jgi:urease accessory protein
MPEIGRLVMDSAWLVSFLQLNDTFYPTGAYAHSCGLEGLVAEGVVRDRDSLQRFIESSVLPTLARVELPLAVHAWEALGERHWPRVGELCQLGCALKTPRELRLASENIGRQRVELCVRLRRHTLAEEFLTQADAARWPISIPVASALEARVLDAPIDAALSSIYYSTVAGLLAAAMKLLRLGQNGAQGLLTDAMSQAPHILKEARTVPIEEIGWFNPWLDIAAARHERAEARLFIS